MPFERYLRDDDDSNNAPFYTDYNPYHQQQQQQVQFQIPSFMLNGPPALAPGGGAEVLPVGMLDNSSYASQWLLNNGFAPFHSPSPAFSWNKQFSSDSIPSDIPPLPSIDPHQLPHPPSQPPSVYHQPPLSHISIPSSTPPLPSPEPSPHVHHVPHELISPPQIYGAPSAGGLPVYSSSGFDLLSVLARVVTRPHPKIVLGPIDASCSFVVSDVRRHDAPIIYASPSFYHLTGFDEHEVIGRNCRFLQAPDGNVHRGEFRRFVSQEAVTHLKKALSADKECQASLINYRKNGQAFINLVTVIPVTGGISNRLDEQDEIAYHVGFQVDLTEQPNAILQKLRDGSYIVNYSSTASLPQSLPLSARDRRLMGPPPAAISKDLKALLLDDKFIDSIPLTTAANLPISSSSSKSDTIDGNQLLNMVLLESLPDFILVLSLKGAFLYVAPSVRLSLGYEADEMVNKNMDEFCHQGDKVRLERELKESSVVPSEAGLSARAIPRPVDAVFRARSKAGPYVWVECRGRLHVEPGKGRKAIILSARVKPMARLLWGSIAQGGGLAYSQDMHGREGPSEFWGMTTASGTLTVVGAGAEQVLGWKQEEMTGRELQSFVSAAESIRNELSREQPCPIVCNAHRKDGSMALVQVVLYRLDGDDSSSLGNRFVCQVKEAGAHVRNDFLDMNTDVFEGLDATRESAWHYELEQLKKNYDRLASEVQALEAGTARRDSLASGSSATPPPAAQSSTPFPVPKEWRSLGQKRAWVGDDGP
ncbi:hypothetical protein CONPUDRAFT_167667 [Coniophora puteana RWD-64-598 SS2]|uniref:PAS domain-containing protein n=1 Tax=Coniophora puteana (strain RWD-64-598) TaxID=741705 RepID=A0A5M3MIY2_CONPW|nr:uncharacterized protein CONPUDRAFT_167667 [Coniophora puteana RWD-64-598 SS2]EIW78744.1 hypothetical protein CONPUDRAFT_167667 [Coniophora puteana RWD-64-598 SS2]